MERRELTVRILFHGRTAEQEDRLLGELARLLAASAGGQPVVLEVARAWREEITGETDDQ